MIADVLHPSILRVTGQVVMDGETVSSTLIVWTQVVVFPQASLTVQILVTIIGQDSEATSIYLTVLTPQASEVTPRLGAFSNTDSLDVVKISRSRTCDGTGVTTFNIWVIGHVAIAGATVSSIVIVWTIFTLVLLHASVTLYIRVISIGQVPVEVCVLVTTKSPSAVHPSAICRLPDKASSDATVVTAQGHPQSASFNCCHI